MEGLGFTIDVRAGGSDETDLEERRRVVEERVRRAKKDIVDVLRVDFPLFFKRAVKERFMSAPAFADALTDAELKALKKDVDEAGRRAVDELIPPLDEESIWFVDTIPEAADRRDLAANAQVQARIQKVGGYLKDVLSRYGFKDFDPAEFDEAYKLPSWFIAGKLLLTTVESYWRDLEELRSLKEALGQLHEKERRSKRAERWDSL